MGMQQNGALGMVPPPNLADRDRPRQLQLGLMGVGGFRTARY